MGASWNDIRLDSRIKLSDGNMMPILGLGTYRSGIGRQTRESVREAVDMGYRLIDTATVYGNERDVGAGIRESERDRSEVFVTTKLWNSDQGYESTKRAFLKSLEMLSTGYVDLYLIHWPVGKLRKDSWKAMEELKNDNMARSIGVSNFTIEHLKDLMEGSNIVPSVNQVEFSPFTYQKDLHEFCRENGIQLQSYSPLTKAKKLDHPVVKRIADEVGKTAAQVLLRWVLQKEIITIPKSTKPERIKENADIFDFSLTSGQMEELSGLDENLRTGWDPSQEE